MAISDKLTYLNTTKSQLKDQINYGLPTEKQITNSTTFRNYVSSIFEAFLEALRNPDTLFNNLPKTSGSGSQITLNGTANAPMRINLNPTAISQTTYTGKNLFTTALRFPDQTTNGITVKNNGDGSFTITGTATETFDLAATLTNEEMLSSGTKLQAGTYTQQIASRLQLYDANGTWKTNTWGTFTTTEELYIQRMFITLTSGTTYNFTKWYQVEKGSTATSYEPYVGGTASPNPSYPQDIHTISGNNSVVVNGKNLLDNSKITANSKCTISNEVITSSTLSNWDNFTCKINDTPLEPNTDYYVTAKIKLESGTTGVNYIGALYNGSVVTDRTMITKPPLTNEYQTYCCKISTTTENFVGKQFFFQCTTSENAIVSVKDIILSKTPNDTYVPYQEPQTAPINLGEYELGTIGNYSNEFVRSGGENLFNVPSTYTITRVINESLELEAGTYTLSYKSRTTTGTTASFMRFTYNDSSVKDITINSTTLSYTIELTKPVVSYNLYSQNSYSASASVEAIFQDLQLNKGTTALPYTPYEKGWYYKQGIGKVVLDGSETIVAYAQDTTRSTFKISNVIPNSPIISASTIPNVKSSHYTPKSYSDSWPIGTLAINGSREIFLVNPKSLIDYDANVFKTWLSSNNVTLYYPLDTPTYTKITGELASQLEQVYKGMLSYDGTTNISQVNNDLSFNLGVSAITK